MKSSRRQLKRRESKKKKKLLKMLTKRKCSASTTALHGLLPNPHSKLIKSMRSSEEPSVIAKSSSINSRQRLTTSTPRVNKSFGRKPGGWKLKNSWTKQ